ncbi:MAG: DUF5682 family protein [Chitinophagaceae bacterium]|nr:DUF5682 family protein [Chitinophagaceae bacterium]
MIHILGIRHHGPGSAKNLKAFLEELKPDIVLVEGPPEADALLQFANHPNLVPPVAILAYQTDNIQQSVYYPFAEFSPEWQAIQYARKANIHVRFMDLPLTHWFAIEQAEKAKIGDAANAETAPVANSVDAVTETVELPHKNPTHYLAEAAGFYDEEKWWEHMFEHRLQNEDVFLAVNEAMQVLRENFTKQDDKEEQLREAWMRKMIRQAEKEMFQNIAVICGAWHAPALTHMPKAKDDNDLLKGLPKVKIETTWIPWTYSRLSMYSGYGAGIESPGWYEHVWKHPNDNGTLWMAKVAQLFRNNQMDTSVAHVIEAIRLAESLASLRNISKAGLAELNEATLSVLCNGETVLLQLIQNELIVSNKIGTVPDDIPKPPLQVDIEKIQKKLRLTATADWKDYMLDLRKENDLERSIFLHRLALLGIQWGNKSLVSGKGTFKEQWRLQWDPSFVISIIEKGVWGNTLDNASNAWLIHQCNSLTDLKSITALLKEVIPADLSNAAEAIAQRILAVAAATNDVIQLVNVLPGLVGIMRYGNVRKTDADMVRQIVESMITRVCIGLPAACCGINEEMAVQITEDCVSINHSIQVLQEADYLQQWNYCLHQITFQTQAAPMMRGFAARQLMDASVLTGDDLQNLFYSSLSRSLPVAEAAAWLEGFLKGSGTLLLIDDKLWLMVNSWVQQLDEDSFVQALPLLRRTFSNFTNAERRKLGEKVKHGNQSTVLTQFVNNNFDAERGKKGLPIIMELLGYQL